LNRHKISYCAFKDKLTKSQPYLIYHFLNSFSTKVAKNSPSYFHHLGEYPLHYRTVGQQISISGEKYANREAIVSGNERITFAELKDQVIMTIIMIAAANDND
jgi:hypothetical protein